METDLFDGFVYCLPKKNITRIVQVGVASMEASLACEVFCVRFGIV